MKNFDLTFFKNKNILITGHTGFKGSWLSTILIEAGANVFGYSLPPPTSPSLFELAKLDQRMDSNIGDVRDLKQLTEVFHKADPEIVIHLAAQPLVLASYRDPRYTYETNVMGTVNFLECVRNSKKIKAALNVTTDKVYLNKEWCWGYRENEELDGFDPYSNSKSCSELVTHSYNRSFFNDFLKVSTARAGNVIGGGDFSDNRIIPDCLRAIEKGKEIQIRNPNSIRPYQHVLEPLFAYLDILKVQAETGQWGYFNVGPNEEDCITTLELVKKFCKAWGKGAGWLCAGDLNAPHEANFLKLDCSKIKTDIGWCPTWGIDDAVQKVCEFNKVYIDGGDIYKEMSKEIHEFLRFRNE